MAGIKSDVKVHSGRHSFAMLMISKGLSIDEVAELLGANNMDEHESRSK